MNRVEALKLIEQDLDDDEIIFKEDKKWQKTG